MNRSKKLVLNTTSSFTLQAVLAACGIIIPRLIISAFGSDVNGLIQSITQFLSAISFFELGIGAVIQSALYKPLAESDDGQISRIIKSGSNYFKKVAIILACYIAVLSAVYPLIIGREYSRLYVVTLILILSLGAFAQYCFGLVDSLLLNSAQYGYIQFSVSIVLTILNTFICWLMIRSGFSIHIVKALILSLISPLN